MEILVIAIVQPIITRFDRLRALRLEHVQRERSSLRAGGNAVAVLAQLSWLYRVK